MRGPSRLPSSFIIRMNSGRRATKCTKRRSSAFDAVRARRCLARRPAPSTSPSSVWSSLERERDRAPPELLLGVEVVLDEAQVGAGALRDLAGARAVEAALGEDLERGDEDPLARSRSASAAFKSLLCPWLAIDALPALRP